MIFVDSPTHQTLASPASADRENSSIDSKMNRHMEVS